jgi:prepilin-type N-terminal cleavage/methylation domain-containing protein
MDHRLTQRCRAFTLIEAIFTIAIAGVLAGALMTLINFHNREVNDAIAQSALFLQTDYFRTLFAKEIKKGSTVQKPDDFTLAVRDRNDNVIWIIHIRPNDHVIEQQMPFLPPEAIEIADKVLRVAENPENVFTVANPTDNQVVLDCRLVLDYAGRDFEGPRIRGVYHCRTN